LALDKPAGPTSHDVVADVRRAVGERRLGHGGTLDPAATGLLVLAVGPATRLTRLFLDHDKTYVAHVSFGSETDTLDAEGEVVVESIVPEAVLDDSSARRAVESMLGTQTQKPPAHSAVKVGGRKAYEAARRGSPLDLPEREITVHDAALVEILADAPPTWVVRFVVSKGTYIRSLARDLGRAMGTHAHLSALRRTASGPVTLDAAHTLPGVLEAARGGAVEDLFLPSADVLGLPLVEIDERETLDVTHGRSLAGHAHVPPDTLVGLVRDGRLQAVYRGTGESLRPTVVLPGGCA
jgi:tRNA pseudouridine55 synthase